MECFCGVINCREHQKKNNDDGNFGLSLAIGAATDSAIIGTVIGGDVAGAILGDILGGGGLFD